MESIDKKKFARNLNNILLKKNWTQTDLARHTDIDVGNINAYVNGRCFPKVTALWKISRALGMTMDELVRKLGDEEIALRQSELTEDETKLIDGYRSLNDESKRLIFGMIRQLNFVRDVPRQQAAAI